MGIGIAHYVMKLAQQVPVPPRKGRPVAPGASPFGGMGAKRLRGLPTSTA